MAATEEYCLLPKPFEGHWNRFLNLPIMGGSSFNLAYLGVLQGGWLTCIAGGGLLASLIDTHPRRRFELFQ